MSELVDKLSEGDHAVEASRYESIEDFESAVADGMVLIKFTETRGGTELGVHLDEENRAGVGSDDSGPLSLKGSLTLDYVPVECVVELDRETLKGRGFLKRK